LADKSIIIIGAGIAGLAAGCYGRMNGYGVQIFEQDSRPGGLCTAWERKGYTINGGLCVLGGSGPGTSFYRIWEELSVVPKIRMIDYDYCLIIEGAEGKTFFMHNDIDRFERHLKELAPEDSRLIEEFTQGARVLAEYDLPVEKAQELLTPFDKMKIMFTRFPLLRAIGKYKKVSIKEFSGRFKNPFLREAFYQVKALFSDDAPVLLFQLFLAWFHLKSAGFPEGGSLEFARAIERHYFELGGAVQYRKRVAKILVENGHAVGVRLEDGSEHYADYVISAADGRTTIFEMLDGNYLDDKIREYYEKLSVGPSPILIALGVSRLFKELPHAAFGIIYRLKAPVTIGGKEVSWLRPMIYNYDPSLAPEAKTAMRVVLPSDYDYWRKFWDNPVLYREEKEKIADTVIGLLEQRFPGISAQVEMRDVATPITFERYTGNWKGSCIGWDVTTKTFSMPMSKTLPGLRNFWMAGQWVEPGGGIPMVAVSGRNVIQLVCKQDKKPFVASVPD
jgi:phytoene dehydrogenase-like protein